MGNCGLIGAFSSVSGKADITLTTNGDILYYNSGRQRLAIGSEGTVLTVSGSDLPAWEAASAGVALSDNNTWTGINIFNSFLASTPTELTISSGVVTATRLAHKIDTEGAASSDTLTHINGYDEGRLLSLQAENTARTVTLDDEAGGAGTLNMAGDFSLDNHEDTITFVGRYSDGLTWCEVSRSDNGS